MNINPSASYLRQGTGGIPSAKTPSLGEAPKTDAAAKPEQSVKKNPGELMVDGLIITADPTGEIANAAYWEERGNQLKEVTGTIETYYAKAHEENLSFDDPYSHIVAKYMFPDSPYFRSDMTEAERQMSFQQETAILRGTGVQFNDPYALASTGGVRNIDKAVSEAVQKRLTQAREELLEKVGGESTHEASLKRMQEKLDKLAPDSKPMRQLDRIV